MDEPHNYFLSRLILIAKRPLGMVAYCRLEHNTMRSYRFECVPLEILIAKHPDVSYSLGSFKVYNTPKIKLVTHS